MKRNARVVILLFLVYPFISFSQTNHQSLNYLYNITGKSVLAGQEAMQYWEPMHDVTGKYPALFGEDLSFSPWQGTSTMDEWRGLVVSKIKTRWNEGAVISLMFHSCPPTQAEPCDWDSGIKGELTDTQWTELITDGTTMNNNWKARLDIISVYLQELKDAGIEVLFRPLHEMNQGAFWWGGRPGPNGTAKLYQITHDYLVNQKGLTNLIWVWDLQDFSTIADDINNYDPGSDYWDVLALDIYYSDGSGFTVTKYNLISAKAGNKPIAIGECGTLPTVAQLVAQPKWTFFMGWAELTQQQNTNNSLSLLYNSIRVTSLDEMPGWAPSDVEETTVPLPAGFGLMQNYPNPFNPATNIKYRITEEGFVTLKVYDTLGREVAMLVNEEKQPGEYSTCFNASFLASGVYCCRLECNNKISVNKMILEK